MAAATWLWERYWTCFGAIPLEFRVEMLWQRRLPAAALAAGNAASALVLPLMEVLRERNWHPEQCPAAVLELLSGPASFRKQLHAAALALEASLPDDLAGNSLFLQKLLLHTGGDTLENGKWKMENGKWKMGNGKWDREWALNLAGSGTPELAAVNKVMDRVPAAPAPVDRAPETPEERLVWVANWRRLAWHPNPMVREAAWKVRLEAEEPSRLEPELHLAVLTEKSPAVLEVLARWCMKVYAARPDRLPSCWMKRYADFALETRSGKATDDSWRGWSVCRKVLFHLDREFRLKALRHTRDHNELEFVLRPGVFDRDILRVLTLRVEENDDDHVLFATLRNISPGEEIPWEDRVAWGRAWAKYLTWDERYQFRTALHHLESLWASGLAAGWLDAATPPPLWDKVVKALQCPPAPEAFWDIFDLARSVPWQGRRASLFAALEERFEELLPLPDTAPLAALMRLAQYELILEVVSSPAAQKDVLVWRHLRNLFLDMDRQGGRFPTGEAFWRAAEAAPAVFPIGKDPSPGAGYSPLSLLPVLCSERGGFTPLYAGRRERGGPTR